MTSNLAPTIDALGALRAQMAVLEAKETELKAALAELEPGKYEGETFVLTISASERGVLDMKAARQQLGPKWVAANTVTSPVRTLRTTVRAEVAAAAC